MTMIDLEARSRKCSDGVITFGSVTITVAKPLDRILSFMLALIRLDRSRAINRQMSRNLPDDRHYGNLQ